MTASTRQMGSTTEKMTKGMHDGKPHKKTTPDGKQENLGEVRIKYTDCSKVTTGGE